MRGPPGTEMFSSDPGEDERPSGAQHAVYFRDVSTSTAERDRVETADIDEPVERPIGERQSESIALLDGDQKLRLGRPAPGRRDRSGREVHA